MTSASISVSNLAKEYGDRVLFSGASFQLDPGQRYGVVGANGSGKTTLLKILAGDLEPTEGSVSIPKSARVGVLRQDHFLHEDEEILGVALMGNEELWEAMVEKERMLAATAEDPEAFDADRFSELEETVQRYDGYTAEARAARVLEGLGIPEEVHRDPLSTLSGGFKLRVLLAQVLASAPDVLLLDEPTNHLDILSIRWLEKFLHEFQGPVAVISHDHRFLDNVSTSILDVDYETVTLYPGNYSDFERQKKEERERREKEIAAREKEIQHHQEFVDRFRAKASKARQAQSKLRMIEKKSEELVELPKSSRRYPTFRFEQCRPSGKEVLSVEGIRKAFDDDEVLHGVDLTVNRGDRLAILGPNGIGKSTLLKIVMGELDPDAGTVEWGYETHPGYFAQDHHEQLDDPNQTAEQWLWDFCPGKDRGFVRGHMGLVLFTGDDGKKRLSALSGGEAARLVFSRLALERPNVLVLDEPTNHLDLESIEALLEGLKEFDGTLILVSHDRWFVSQLATRIVEIRPDGVLDFPGTYEEYVHHCGDDHLDVDEVVLKAKRNGRGKGTTGSGASTGPNGQTGGSAAPAPRGSKESAGNGGRETGGSVASRDATAAPEQTLSKHERRRRRRKLERRSEEIATSIQETESRLEELDELFCEPGFFEDASEDEIAARNEERAWLKNELESLFEEWEEVEEELEAQPTL